MRLMPQDQETGAEGNKFGHEMAAKVAEILGTQLISKNSNEINYDGKLFVIKSAHKSTPDIGLTVNILERVQGIIAALENKDGNGYTLYKVDLDWYRAKMTPSLSRKHKHGKVMRRSCKQVRKECKVIAVID